MIVDAIESFLNKHNIKPKKISANYVTLAGKNCKIIIWYSGKVQIFRGKPQRVEAQFDFADYKMKKYMVKEE